MNLNNIDLAKSRIALYATPLLSLTSKLSFVEDPSIETACTDGRRVYYNPVWVDTLEVAEAIGLVVHEIMHNMYSHPARMGNRDSRLANCAMDIVGNPIVLRILAEYPKLGGRLPETELVGPKWDKYTIPGTNYEAVYSDLLREEKEESEQGQPGQGQPGQGQPGQGQPGSQGAGQGPPQPSQQPPQSGAGQPQPGTPGQGQQGQKPPSPQPQAQQAQPTKPKIQQWDSVIPLPRDDGKGDPKSAQEAKDRGAAPQSELEGLANEWAMAVQQAATMAKARGLASGCFDEFVRTQLTTHVDWKSQVVEAIFKAVGTDDLTWQRFNRRRIHNELYTPGMYSEHINLIVQGTDTSGSMDTTEFRLALGALNEIFEELKPKVLRHIQCDTVIHHIQDLTMDDMPMTVGKFKGRGGTVLAPIFQHIYNKMHGEEPELVVILTDGAHDVIDKKWQPQCPVIWLVTTEATSAAEKSFGRVIKIRK